MHVHAHWSLASLISFEAEAAVGLCGFVRKQQAVHAHTEPAPHSNLRNIQPAANDPEVIDHVPKICQGDHVILLSFFAGPPVGWWPWGSLCLISRHPA